MRANLSFLSGAVMAVACFRQPGMAGDFSKSFGRGDLIKLQLPKLPAVYTGAKRVSVVLDESPTGFPSDRMRAGIENRLSADFTISPSNPEMTFRVRVFLEAPKSEITAKTESVRVQTGVKPANDSNGNPIVNAAGQTMVEPVYENKDVPMEVWQGSGRLSLQVEVFGAGGQSIDGFSPSQSFAKRAIVSANGVAQIDRNQIPSEPQILEALINAVSETFPERYCRRKEIIEVRLAVDEELRQGNELAKAGQWDKAAELWKAVEPRKFPGDRLHNLGFAYEAIFYDRYWNGEPLNQLEAALDAARKLHDDAILRDPREKAHAQAQDRIRFAANLLQRLKKVMPGPVEETNRAAGSVGSGGGILTGSQNNAIPGDALPPVVQEFRRLVRMRVRNLAVTPDNELQTLESTGTQAFQFSPEAARKHINEEVEPLAEGS